MLNLREYRQTADRLADHLPWAALVAAGVVLNKDGGFQRTLHFRGPDMESATEAELVEYCRDNMAYFMVPRYVELRAEFPRTLNQKIEKYQLRQAMEANLERAWDREKAGIVVRR